MKQARPIALSLALVAVVTLCLIVVTGSVAMEHVSSAYLVPVLIAATRLGVTPAIVAAVAGVATSAFLFYPPIYDFRITNSNQLLELPLFVVVAAVTGQLATRARHHARLAQDQESEMRGLYEFSKRLAMATEANQIHDAIRDHLSFITGCKVRYFAAGAPVVAPQRDDTLPVAVWRAANDLRQGHGNRHGIWIDGWNTGERWLVRAIALDNPDFGLVAINVGGLSDDSIALEYGRIDAVLADAAATLARLDVANALAEAKVRADAETLRAALMGSVSHGLRTPLASIVGSASILVKSPAVAQDPQLADLAGIIRDEADRLNGDIQRLLDATSISSAGVQPRLTWADTTDIVNAAMAAQEKRLAMRKVEVRLADDLPLVYVDPVLIEQALRQVIDNAVKYSAHGSLVRVEAYSQNGDVVISVTDQGVGLTAEDTGEMFNQFYRGVRAREATSGSGLGLWVARAFVAACSGRIEAKSEGAGCGTTIIIALPHSTRAVMRSDGETDE
jgi:two-component system sensor histidine kinase KdpD